MKKGLITKVLHKGQKVYGVITGFDETNATVRFPFYVTLPAKNVSLS